MVPAPSDVPRGNADGDADAGDRDEDAGPALARRRFLAAQSLLVTGAVAGCPGSGDETSTTTPPADATSTTTDSDADGDGPGGRQLRNTVTVTPADRTETPVSDQLFGRLCEHYCSGTIYPGVYSQHVKNPTFYPREWSPSDHFGPKTFYDPATIDRHDGVPFPWEPLGGESASFEQRQGGVAAVETTGYQRVSVAGASGGIAQKTVLPDFRTLSYELGVSVRGSVDRLTVAIRPLADAGGAQVEAGEPVATAEIPVGAEWGRHEVDLTLREAAGDQYDAGGAGVETPYGQYRLSFTVAGSGHADLDFVTLAADDAVEGRFNPSTVALMREKNTTWLKWPGGNFTSQYNWRDGVGPLAERPARFNHAWGGVEPNFFGTDEYLRLCELCDLTPRITVGWWDDPPAWASERQIRPSDAADWVAYCNAPADTEMGALRAANGHPEPYGVEHWEVGNEVYGPWQRGDTQDPSVYASGGGPEDREGFNAYYDAMTAVDPSITVYADGMSPGYEEPNLPDPDAWNETLFAESGGRLDGVDLHHYSWGIRDESRRRRWYDEHTEGVPRPGYWEYSEVLISFPTQFGALLEELAGKAAAAGVEDFAINVGEWGLFPAVDGPYPGPETTPGGAYYAGMLNAFVRQSEHVREACNTWVPVRMFPPEFTQFPPDPNPLTPAGTVHTLYATLFEGDAEWHAVDVGVSGASRTIPETGYRIRRTEDVPYVDAAAMRAADGPLAVFLTNRNLWDASAVTIELGEAFAGAPVALTRLRATASERPLPHAFQNQWGEPEAYEVVTSTRAVGEDGTLSLEVGPASVVRLLVGGDGLDLGDGVWGGVDGVLEPGRPYTAGD